MWRLIPYPLVTAALVGGFFGVRSIQDRLSSTAQRLDPQGWSGLSLGMSVLEIFLGLLVGLSLLAAIGGVRRLPLGRHGWALLLLQGVPALVVSIVPPYKWRLWWGINFSAQTLSDPHVQAMASLWLGLILSPFLWLAFRNAREEWKAPGRRR